MKLLIHYTTDAKTRVITLRTSLNDITTYQRQQERMHIITHTREHTRLTHEHVDTHERLTSLYTQKRA